MSLHEEVLGLPSLKFAEFQAEEGNQGAVSGLVAIESGRFDQVPYKFEASLSVPYITIGQPERWVELCRNMIARWPDAHMYALARLVLALTITGAGDEAMKTSEGLLAAANATDNPHVVSLALSSRTPMPAATPILSPRITFLAEA